MERARNADYWDAQALEPYLTVAQAHIVWPEHLVWAYPIW